MSNIQRQQILNRLDILPLVLKEAFFSDSNYDIISQICELNHLSQEKISNVIIAVHDVILGFIHPEDLAKEIQSETGINIEIAKTISEQINRKILLPIKIEIDKIYYSPSKAEEHILDLRTQKIETAVEKEIQKIEPEKIIPSEPAPIQREAVPIGEAPLIIHKEMESKPVLGAKRPLSGFFSALSGKEEIKPIMAQVEIFTPEQPIEEQLKKIKIMPEEKKSELSEPKIIHEEPPKPREVHYSDLRTPIIPIEPAKTELKKEIFQQKEIKMSEPFPKISEIIPPIKKPVKKGIFSRLFGLFFSKEKTLKEIPSQDTTAEIPLPKIMPEIKKEQPRPEIKPIETPRPKIFAENLPIPPAPQIKPLVETPIKSPSASLQPEIVKIPSQAPSISPVPKVEPPKISPNEEIIDLRTFEKFKNNKNT